MSRPAAPDMRMPRRQHFGSEENRLIFLIDRGDFVVEHTSPKRSSPGFRAESHVTARECLGSGGIPTAAPHSAPCSERLAVPTHPARAAQADSAGNDGDPPNGARLGPATLTME